ncbi:hypothetical protein M9H77_16383 [Catharanthus roseus]|uniref:Uncharacterized protein n=1 Tax=Catharanthus roseus TaxID=4058 RepID=A0ACC0B1L2_CATRO|nr:hypothetical protein M9H77_16383 [Catharanthus roseus]
MIHIFIELIFLPSFFYPSSSTIHPVVTALPHSTTSQIGRINKVEFDQIILTKLQRIWVIDYLLKQIFDFLFQYAILFNLGCDPFVLEGFTLVEEGRDGRRKRGGGGGDLRWWKKGREGRIKRRMVVEEEGREERWCGGGGRRKRRKKKEEKGDGGSLQLEEEEENGGRRKRKKKKEGVG